MKKTLNTQRVTQAMDAAGLNQTALAKKLDVTKEAVSQWLKQVAFPRPDKLLKLAKLLNLDFNELVIKDDEGAPIVAFRKVKATRTKDHHIEKAQDIGRLLRHLVPYLPFDAFEVPPTLKDPVNDYDYIQQVARKVRNDINVAEDDAIDFHHLIKRFRTLQTVIVPVLWGEKQVHENAIHIFLPDSRTTWVYLNLDVNVHDFKFWMAHELGHCLSPGLRGDAAEDFADAFAGALLFPGCKAEAAYASLISLPGKMAQLNAIEEIAREETISPFTVYTEANHHAAATGKTPLQLEPDIYKRLHAFNAGYKKLSKALFEDKPPEASEFIEKSRQAFDTPFFDALKNYLKATGQGPGYVQTVMDMPLLDARGIHEALT